MSSSVHTYYMYIHSCINIDSFLLERNDAYAAFIRESRNSIYFWYNSEDRKPNAPATRGK